MLHYYLGDASLVSKTSIITTKTAPNLSTAAQISTSSGTRPAISPLPSAANPDISFSTAIIKASAPPPGISPAGSGPTPALQPVASPGTTVSTAPTPTLPNPTTDLAPIPWTPSTLPPTTYEEPAPASEDRTVIVAPVVSTPTPGAEPIYKTCWFWAILGAAAVGIGWAIKRS